MNSSAITINNYVKTNPRQNKHYKAWAVLYTINKSESGRVDNLLLVDVLPKHHGPYFISSCLQKATVTCGSGERWNETANNFSRWNNNTAAPAKLTTNQISRRDSQTTLARINLRSHAVVRNVSSVVLVLANKISGG